MIGRGDGNSPENKEKVSNKDICNLHNSKHMIGRGGDIISPRGSLDEENQRKVIKRGHQEVIL